MCPRPGARGVTQPYLSGKTDDGHFSEVWLRKSLMSAIPAPEQHQVNTSWTFGFTDCEDDKA
jgi:hypothetical protein